MKRTTVCTALTQYGKLASGRVSSPEKEAVLDHLESCNVCVQKVESPSEKNTLIDVIRQARTLGTGRRVKPCLGWWSGFVSFGVRR
jgi:hypothetical protein